MTIAKLIKENNVDLNTNHTKVGDHYTDYVVEPSESLLMRLRHRDILSYLTYQLTTPEPLDVAVYTSLHFLKGVQDFEDFAVEENTMSEVSVEGNVLSDVMSKKFNTAYIKITNTTANPITFNFVAIGLRED